MIAICPGTYPAKPATPPRIGRYETPETSVLDLDWPDRGYDPGKL